MAISLIHDGDHGGDDFITTLIMLANPEIFDLKAITAVAGNVNPGQAAINALKAISLSGSKAQVPVYVGPYENFAGKIREGDDAFHSDGLGGVSVPETSLKEQSQDAIDYLAHTLASTDEPLTIMATGPLTNMAYLLSRHPDVKNKIKQIVVMGGGHKIGGNIQPYAEFNFYMDPQGADYVLKSGVPIILHTLDTTSEIVFTKARQEQIKALGKLADGTDFGEMLCKIMRITEHLEIATFGSEGAFMHDENTAVFLAKPELYELTPVRAHVNADPQGAEFGRFVIEEEDQNSTVQFVSALKDHEAAFGFILESLRKIVG